MSLGSWEIYIYTYMRNEFVDCLNQDKNVQLPIGKDTMFSSRKAKKAKTCGSFSMFCEEFWP